FPTPQTLAEAGTDEVAAVLHSARAYSHAKRAAELQALPRPSPGGWILSHPRWRQGGIIEQLNALEEPRPGRLNKQRQGPASHAPGSPCGQTLDGALRHAPDNDHLRRNQASSRNGPATGAKRKPGSATPARDRNGPSRRRRVTRRTGQTRARHP